MPKAWEKMSFSEKLDTFRSEAASLKRVIDSVARRIQQIENELKALEGVASARKEDGGRS
jgi:polyhydroxyalkanoate synthesis regulator phasin